MPDLDGHPIPRRAWRFRLKVAAKRTLGVAALVALVVVQGCTTAPSDNGSPAPPSTPAPDPTPPPPPAPPPPPPAPITFDGTYGPGTFTRSFDGCDGRYLSPTFDASIEVKNNGTSVTIIDSGRRESTCVNPTPGNNRCNGSGQIPGGEPATWFVDIQYFGGSNPGVFVGEVLQFPRFGNCVVAHTARMARQ